MRGGRENEIERDGEPLFGCNIELVTVKGSSLTGLTKLESFHRTVPEKLYDHIISLTQ